MMDNYFKNAKYIVENSALEINEKKDYYVL